MSGAIVRWTAVRLSPSSATCGLRQRRIQWRSLLREGSCTPRSEGERTRRGRGSSANRSPVRHAGPAFLVSGAERTSARTDGRTGGPPSLTGTPLILGPGKHLMTAVASARPRRPRHHVVGNRDLVVDAHVTTTVTSVWPCASTRLAAPSSPCVSSASVQLARMVGVDRRARPLPY